ncbi:unnamed protein product [Ilex paraguariensis]|uniref:Peptidase A1 domain-containing protein n=1 Tax=Ilex paraguariensis TaxID=185542 RepID=A0ABC8QWQ3_9AQUA
MAASLLHSLLLFSLLCISFSVAEPSFRPKALVLPVSKDASTLQYITQINQRTPLVPVSVTLDLGGQDLWVDCDQGYVSSTYRPARCRSAQCSLAKSTSCSECFSTPRPGCNNNTCGLFPGNTVTRIATSGDLGSDVVSIKSTDGKNPGRTVSESQFLFVCGSTFLLEGLASGVKGMAGLGRTRISLPSQFSAAFSFPRKFAVCLSSSTRSNGVVFFGDGPYVFLPNKDVSRSLIYTPLIINPVSTASVYSSGDRSAEYFIGVKSIQINEKLVPINTTLLAINSEGYGGTKISTVNPYTVLETSIYNAVINAFVKELSNVPRVAAVAPFGVCFDAKKIGSTRVGPAVPPIDLVLQSQSVYWRLFGANSMVQVSETVLCLGFVDGGVNPTTSIVIGGHQIEDNLLQFDLAASRLGYQSKSSLCFLAPVSLLQSFPKGVLGVAGLAWAPLSLPSLFNLLSVGIKKKFAICLSSTSSAPGVIFFGYGPYYLLPPTNLDAASILSYTPLLKNPKSPDYYISVKAISINGKNSPISTITMALNPLGHGGVNLSSVVPYTTHRSDIYKPFLKSFSQETKGIPRAKTVESFSLCLRTSAIGFSRVGLRVPEIDLELGSGKTWTIYGANSMKQVGPEVACLAFVDGGVTAEQAVVIGSFQMENNLLVFDLGQLRLRFSSSLFFVRIT